MEEKMKWLISVVLGLIATFIHQYGIMIIMVCVAIMFDCVTGLIKAKIEEDLSSEAGTKGFFKKTALLVCLFFGFFLDYIIPYMCESISIKIPYNMPFGLIICFYIVLNECISICENLYVCNPGIMPKWVVKILLSAKQQIDESGDNNEDTEEE